MQPGSKYIDIHDNEVVNVALSERGANLFATPSQRNVTESNLNIDKATVEMSDGRCQMDDVEERAAVLTENEAFMAIMEKAIEKGFCRQEGWRYRWRVKVEAAYFAAVASYTFGLSKKRDHDGDECISWIPFEALFGLKGLRLSYNDYQKCATKVRRKDDIDGLFC